MFDVGEGKKLPSFLIPVGVYSNFWRLAVHYNAWKLTQCVCNACESAV